MLEPDKVPKPWVESVVRKARSHDIAFVEGAASLVLLGGIVAVSKILEKKEKSKPLASWEKRLQEAASSASTVQNVR